MSREELRNVAKKIATFRKVLLFPHVNMDGDSLGSSFALCLGLRQLGLEAFIYAGQTVPHNLDFLGEGCLTEKPPFSGEEYLSLLIDCGSRSRVPGREAVFDAGCAHACIDHHASVENDTAFDFSYIEPKSAATGELIYMVLRDLGVTMTLPMAEAVYTALSTDTGSFQHSNTTARTHCIAAELHEVEGFSCKKIASLIYDRNSLASMKLEGRVFEVLHSYCDGALLVSRVTQDMLRKTGCTMEDADRMVSRLQSIDGAEVSCLLKEQEDGIIRGSLRAKSYMNVAAVAERFGGGGHLRAAGFRKEGTVDEIEHLVTDALIRSFREENHEG